MSGLALLLLLVGATGVVMRLAGLKGPLLTAALAALMFGSAAYLVQGRPGLAGDPRAATGGGVGLPLGAARAAFFGNFGANDHWQVMADSLASRGDLDGAAGIMASAVRDHPRDAALWTGLGNTLVDQAGMLTPPARFAFAEAQRLAPGHPGPAFFLGLGEARSENPAEALRLWKKILEGAPANAQWRPFVVQGLAAIGGDVAAPPSPAGP